LTVLNIKIAAVFHAKYFGVVESFQHRAYFFLAVSFFRNLGNFFPICMVSLSEDFYVYTFYLFAPKLSSSSSFSDWTYESIARRALFVMKLHAFRQGREKCYESCRYHPGSHASNTRNRFEEHVSFPQTLEAAILKSSLMSIFITKLIQLYTITF
jgi:hypothetical protein